MATIGADVRQQITSEVDLFGSMMQQNVIENEFNRENAPLATIQPGVAIEFTDTGSNDLYLNLNNSRLHVLVNITKADGTNIEANTAAPINLTLHSMFREIQAYSTFLQELECDTWDKIVSLTPSEWANEYTLYAFKITDGPIGPGTYGPRSKSVTGSASLVISFAAAVNGNIKVIINYQMLVRIEFDKFHAVVVLWVSKVNFTLGR